MAHAPSLALFLFSAAVLIVMPGPAVLYITARSISQGRSAGLVSVLGIQTGTLVHVIAAAVGLSAILVSSALAFEIVRYLGAAGARLKGSRAYRRRERIVSGGAYIALGLAAAIAGGRRQ